jgi:tetratricopeptide (TPR) repeat protein
MCRPASGTWCGRGTSVPSRSKPSSPGREVARGEGFPPTARSPPATPWLAADQRLVLERETPRLSRLVEELRAELTQEGLSVVEALWDAAYRGVSDRAARLYRLLADHPGPYVTPDAVVALLGEGVVAAEDALDELNAVSLLEARLDGHLYLHDLLREHARRWARRDGDAAEADTGRRRIVKWLRRQAERADLLTDKRRMRLIALVPPLPDAPDVSFDDESAARRWLHRERSALFGAVSLAYAHGYDTDAWSLCVPLWTFHKDHPHYAEEIAELFGMGVAAAGRAGQHAGQCRMRCQRAEPLWQLGRFDEAERELASAVGAAEVIDAGDARLLPSTIEFRGKLRAARGDWLAAAADFERSLALHRAIPNPYGVLLQSHLLGRAMRRLGRLDRAAELLEAAHAMAQRHERRRMIGRTACELAAVCQEQGEWERASELYERALAHARERHSEDNEARVRTALAELAEAAGDAPAARAHRDAVRAIHERVGKLPPDRPGG